LITSSNRVGWHDWEVAGLLALKNPPGVNADLMCKLSLIGDTGAVTDQPSGYRVLRKCEAYRNSMARGQRNDLVAPAPEERFVVHQECSRSLLNEHCKGCMDLALGAGFHDQDL
jgi:hypothetical protein